MQAQVTELQRLLAELEGPFKTSYSEAVSNAPRPRDPASVWCASPIPSEQFCTDCLSMGTMRARGQ